MYYIYKLKIYVTFFILFLANRFRAPRPIQVHFNGENQYHDSFRFKEIEIRPVTLSLSPFI